MYRLSGNVGIQLKTQTNRGRVYSTQAALLVLNCVGLVPKGPNSSLSSLALQKGNISRLQVGPQKAGLYLQRARSQRAICMRKHVHRCTMEYIYTQQRSFVTPVPRQRFIFFSFQTSLRQLSLVSWRSWGRRGTKNNTNEKKKYVCLDSSRGDGRWVEILLCFPHNSVSGESSKITSRQN